MNRYFFQIRERYGIQYNYQKNHGGIRIKQRFLLLKHLQHLLENNKEVFQNAVHADLGKSKIEFSISEFIPVIHELKLARRKLNKWTKINRAGKSITYFATTCYTRFEPKGVVLIISPWNFPFLLSLGPVISALAAGNSIILKPSEFSPATSEALANIINSHFDPEFIRVETGSAQTAIDLQKLPFNHVFFTGSPSVGKKVMEAASKHLASVTLELGGKSPVIIDRGTNLKDTAAKIATGKFLNCGQACVAPDYVFIHSSELDIFIKNITDALYKLYYQESEILQQNPDYGRIVNARHFRRLEKLFVDAVDNGATVINGGKSDPDKLFFEPTILTDVHPDTELMNEEIFGPVLPLLAYEKESDVIDFILSKPRPLSLYLFSKNKRTINLYLNRISSGNASVNEVIIQFLHPHLPFGGINNSGFGSSHGYFGFKAFSHERAILKQSPWFSITRFLSPPYGKSIKRLIVFIEKHIG